MWVTIYTDASFSKNDKGHHGAYAYWIRSSLGRKTNAQACPEKVDNINLAEIWCIIQAVRCAINAWDNIEGIQINSDSQHALRTLQHLSSKDERERLLCRYYKDEIIGKRKIRLRYKHIKAHTKGKGTREWLNRWCDEKSKEIRSKLIKQQNDANSKT